MAAVGTEAQISRALLQRLVVLTLSPALPVAWPDDAFTKPLDANGKPLPYLEATLMDLPVRTISVTDGADVLSGLFQVTVVYPQNSGIIKPREIAAKVRDHFKRHTVCSDGATTLEITKRPDVAQTYGDAPYTRTPVTIRYQCFATA